MSKENQPITLWSLALILATSGQAQAQTAPPIVGQAVQRHMVAKPQQASKDPEIAPTTLPSAQSQSTDKNQVLATKDAQSADSKKLDASAALASTASALPPGEPGANKASDSNAAVSVTAESLQSAPSIAQPSPLRLVMGQRLSTTLRSWLQDRGMSLSWEAQGSMPGRMRDVSLTRDWVSSSTDLARTLAEALAPFGLSADIVQSSQTVVVRNSTAAQASPAIQ